MRATKAVVTAVGLFLLGAMAGGAGMHLFYAQKITRPPMRGPGGPPWLGERMLRHLELDAEQEKEARRIFEETRSESESLRHEIRPRFEEVLERGMSRFEEILTPEQREEYQEIRKRYQERMDSFLRGPHGPRRGKFSRGDRKRRPPESSHPDK